jgi:hypothetical protein
MNRKQSRKKKGGNIKTTNKVVEFQYTEGQIFTCLHLPALIISNINLARHAYDDPSGGCSPLFRPEPEGRCRSFQILTAKKSAGEAKTGI